MHINLLILKDIIFNYGLSYELEADIAERYNTNEETISKLLQLCGFRYHKRDTCLWKEKEQNRKYPSLYEAIEHGYNDKKVIEICNALQENIKISQQ